MDPTNKKLQLLREKLKKKKDVDKMKVRAKVDKPKEFSKKESVDKRDKKRGKKITKTKQRFVLESEKPSILPTKMLTLKPAKKAHRKTPDYLYTSKLLEDVKEVSYKKKEHYYSYPIKESLQQDFETISLEEKKTKIHLCIYNVNMSGPEPFLQYLLYKSNKSQGDKVMFPFIKYSGSDDVMTFTKKFIGKIIDGFDMSIESDGFITIGSHHFIFFNVGEIVNTINKNMRSNKLWWTLLYEIVNIRKLTNFPILNYVTELFLQNTYLLRLLNGKNVPYQLPNVGYHGTYYTLAEFVETFGLQRSSLNRMLGPYYYFGTFRKAVRYAGWTSTYKPRYVNDVLITDEDGRYKELSIEEKNPGAIIRFALFLGKTKVFLNQPTDKDDVTEEEMKDFERMERKPWNYYTRKLHDYSGKWAEEYNSAYVGVNILENGKKNASNPEIIVKEYEQQMILSSHRLDVSSLQANWEPLYEDYQIA